MRTLHFEHVETRELEGDAHSRLLGVHGSRVRIASLRLGHERLDLVDFLTPASPPMPIDSRSNDRWFQHIAVIVRDMDEAYEHLRAQGVAYASPAPQRLPDWNPNAGGISAFYFRDPDGHAVMMTGAN